MKVTVETIVHAQVQDVWRAWTTPSDIVQWNAASVDRWIGTPLTRSSIFGLEVPSHLGWKRRMEAKDGSMGFDFAGTYTKLVENQMIECSMGDRTLCVEFQTGPEGVTVRETFDAEETHPVEQQQQGWQAILSSFARHV